MAKIWFVKEGDQPTLGGPVAEKSLQWCIENLGLQRSHWKRPPDHGIKIKSDRPDLDAFREPSIVVVEAQDNDVLNSPGWKAGYYVVISLSVQEAKKRLEKTSN